LGVFITFEAHYTEKGKKNLILNIYLKTNLILNIYLSMVIALPFIE